MSKSKSKVKARGSLEPIAIVGMAGIFPKAPGLKGFWRLLRCGIDGIDAVPGSHWSPEEYFHQDQKQPDMTYCQRGGFLSPVDFDPTEFSLPPTVLEATDTSQLLGLVVAKAALEDAGYGANKVFNKEKTSVLLGVTGTLELVVPLGARLGHPIWRKALLASGVDAETAEEVVSRISEDYVPWQENSFPGLLGNVVAGRIANRLDLHGTNCVVDAACASSLSATHLAMMELATGKADMVVTGGVDTFNDIFMYMCFSKTPALSPSGQIRPFSADSDGTLLGEGIGMVVLKRLTQAEADGDRIYAVIRGLGTSSDGNSGAVYAPSSPGQARALRDAYASAGVEPSQIRLLEAHGTGTKVGDVVEFEALKTVYQEAKVPRGTVALGTVKSQIGHTKAAAGSASLIKVALALYNKVFLPTLKVERPNPKLGVDESAFYLSTVSRPWLSGGLPRIAALSSFGFGGSNFHMVLEEHKAERAAVAWDGSVQLLAFSAASADALQRKIQEFKPEGDAENLERLAARTRQEFVASDPARALLVWEADKDLAALLALAVEKIAAGKAVEGPEVFFAPESQPGKVVCMFPGQGSQYPGMGRELACLFPEMLRSLEEVDEAAPGERLTPLIYPPPTFDSEAEKAHAEALTRTDCAQPALGAVNRGMFEILSRFGVVPDFTCGHSYGELCALFAAGCFDAASLNKLSYLRGQLMAKGDGGRGTMAAVTAPVEKVEALLTELKLDVVVANRNSPSQCVLSGEKEAVAHAVAKLKEHGVRAIPLQVGAAFHSSLVASAEEPFRKGLEKVDFANPTLPVYANVSAQPYPAGAKDARDLLAHQLVSKVDFVGQIENLHAAGARTFVEVGPKTVLSKLVGAILKGQPHQVATMDSSGGATGLLDLARTLARLAAVGVAVNLSAWETVPAERRPRKMTVALTGANYRSPRPERKPSAPKKVAAVATASVSAAVATAATASAPAPAATPAPAASAASAPARPAAPAPTTPLVAAAPAQVAYQPPSPVLTEAFQSVQGSLAAMQSLQQQTAMAHQRFLEGQEAAQRTFQAMVESQQRLVETMLGGAPRALPGFAAQAPVYQAPAYQAPAYQAPAVYQAPAAAPAPAYQAPAAAPAYKAPAAAAPAAAPKAPAAAAPAPSPTPVSLVPTPDSGAADKLLAVVADKTGYPREMLNLEMDLETDLGIDSIKRVEILAAVEEALGGAKIEADRMGSLRTLREIVDQLGPVAAPSAPPAPAAAAPSGAAADKLLAVVADKTGYPREMLNLEMDLESDLGIDSIKRVEILAAVEEALGGAKIEADVVGSLRTLGEIVNALAPAAAAHAPAQAPAAGGGAAADKLLAVVADKTGYPREMLNLEMDLESDLGIDSIKRVEILAAVEEALGGAKLESDIVGSLRTLGEIVNALAPHAPAAAPAQAPAAPSGAADKLLAVVADKTGYPREMLNLEMDLEADLGIDSIKRVEILAAVEEALGGARLESDVVGSLRTLGQIVEALGVSAPPVAPSPSPAPPAPAQPQNLERRILQAVQAPLASAPLQVAGPVLVVDDGTGLGPHLVTALGRQGIAARVGETLEGQEAGLILISGGASGDDFLRFAFQLTRQAAPMLRKAGAAGGALLASIVRLDGRFGTSGQPYEGLAGGLTGLPKTAAHEWSEVHCRALDLDPAWNGPEAAEAVVGELGLDGPLEAGLTPGQRWLLTTDLQPISSGAPLLAPGDVVLVTGGARGVTAETAVALAERCKPTLVLLGRSPEPAEEPAWLRGLTAEGDIKRAIMQNHFPKGHTPTPPEVANVYRQTLANREVHRTLERIAEAGSKVLYRPVDVRDAKQVKATVDKLRQRLGPIRGVIHAAGVLADRKIEDKTDEQFDSVFATKILGLRHLLAATADDDLKALVFFSSVTARFGRPGQVDYCMANDVLNKLAQQEARRRPNCRVVSLNWGPWAGGMVTEGLKKEFERIGVGLIELDAGARAMVDELCNPPGGPVEILYGEGFPEPPKGVKPVSTGKQPVFETPLTVEELPALTSHVVGGRPVLPVALMLEWFGHAGLHQSLGARFAGLEGLQVLKAVALEGPSTATLLAGPPMSANGHQVVETELRIGSTLHARARVILQAELSEAPAFTIPKGLAKGTYDLKPVYSQHLFHGPHFQAIQEVEGISGEGLVARVRTNPKVSDWIAHPVRSDWVADPLAVDAALQLGILWGIHELGKPSLPMAIGSYRQYQRRFPKKNVMLVLQVTKHTGHQIVADCHFLDEEGKTVARCQGIEWIADASLKAAFAPQVAGKK